MNVFVGLEEGLLHSPHHHHLWLPPNSLHLSLASVLFLLILAQVMAMAAWCSHAPVVLALGESAMATEATACTSRLSSSFLPRSSPSLRLPQHRPASRQRFASSIRALELDQDTIVAISVGLAGIAVGIGVPVFYETQMKSAATRENDQPCFPCAGSGAQICRFCLGSGNITIELSGGENEVSKCINCEGAGSMTCTTCQGSGIQPRYLDRREFKDDD